MSKIVSQEALEHFVEDYGLEYILEANDITPQMVIQILLNEGLLDLDNLSWETEDDD